MADAGSIRNTRSLGRNLVDSFLKANVNAVIAAGVVVVVMMILVPLPTFLVDTAMAFNLTLSLLIILITLYSIRALDFSVFPTVLLVATLFGLALNVSSTRLILTLGEKFDGKMVRAFAGFVVGTSGSEGIVIGFIIYIVIIAVQFIVITKGSTRISEVAARFTLDAMQVKQMAIEAEYSSGAINEEEARRRKADIQKEADFFGRMDGASKFVSGNVVVGILITVINIIGGLIVGISLHGEGWQNALGTYVSFAIGDGLVSQLPALLVSSAAGILITRPTSEESFGQEVTRQFALHPIIFWIAGAFLFLLGLLPGFPGYILIPMAFISVALAVSLNRKAVRAKEAPAKDSQERPREAPAEISPVVIQDPLSLELGYALIPLVDKAKGAELLERVGRVRKETALDIGLVVPAIRIVDNMILEPSEYCFKIKGVEVGRGTLRPGSYLAIDSGAVREEISGEKTVDPTFGLAALWIPESDRDKAERAGYTVVDPPSIIATHLMDILRKHAVEILGRQELKNMLDALKKDYSVVVDEVLSNLGLGGILKILQNLLRERVSIRNMVEILETLADYSAQTKDVSYLTEKARQSLARQICSQYADDSKTLYVFTLAPKLEQAFIDSQRDTAGGRVAALRPETQRRWINALANAFQSVKDTVKDERHYPVILCSEAVRTLVKASSRNDFPDLVVLSVPELVPGIHTVSYGEIKLEG